MHSFFRQRFCVGADNKSAKIELAKDQFTLEVPVGDITAPSLSADDLTLKVKYSMDFDM